MLIYNVTCLNEKAEIRSMQSFPTLEEAQEILNDLVQDAESYFHSVYGRGADTKIVSSQKAVIGNDDHLYIFQISQSDLEIPHLREDIKTILENYLVPEHRHWQESGEPEDHIYHSLLRLKSLL